MNSRLPRPSSRDSGAPAQRQIGSTPRLTPACTVPSKTRGSRFGSRKPVVELSSGQRRAMKARADTPITDKREEDQQVTKRRGADGKWHGPDRLSKKFDKLRLGNPYATERGETGFSYAYQQGSIPCRINHGVVLSKIQWDEDPLHLDYDPLIVTVSEGLREVKHPYVFVAQNAFKELLETPGAEEKTIPLIPQIVRNLRAAMLCRAEGPFAAALVGIQQLSHCVKDELDAHIGSLLIQINKKSFDRKHKTAIYETLLALDNNGGKDVSRLIKAKVPCFSR
mmetsp:Transcript_16287/g.29792  ORF Transcript_16287/g.29792 Transcript_16287/m.29792 type:complete len:281 (+) Transcript_16287:125-967(+)